MITPKNFTGTLLAFLLLCSAVWACQVPVFRYALERWNADQYRLVILHEGPLHEEVAKLALLSAKPDTADTKHPVPQRQSEVASGRFEVTVVDIHTNHDPRLDAVWKARVDTALPMLAAYYPIGSEAAGDRPAFVSPLTTESLQTTLDSPVRQKIANHLIAGDSAVWIFLESGDTAKDAEAYAILERQLQLDATWLELPSPEELEVAPEILKQAKIPIRINFSIVRLKREDKSEGFLIETLLNSEPDLKQYAEPIAFPVFGRGRVLYALVGKGIADSTIRAASSFIVGPCSCQVKNQNPGFDLLMQCDWNQAVGDTLISEPIESVPTNAAPVLLKIPPGRSPPK